MHERYRQALERLDFQNSQNKPLILTIEEAEGIDTDTYRLYYVSWWGDETDPLPVGFTPCRIEQKSLDGDYVIMVLEDRGYKGIVEYPHVVPADTLLLAFYGSQTEGYDSFLDE